MLNVAPNVAYASVAGLLTAILSHILGAYGIPVTPDEASGLTLVISMLVAHGMDVYTGENKPKDTGNGQGNK